MFGNAYSLSSLETVVFMTTHAFLIILFIYMATVKESKFLLFLAISIAALPIAFRFNMGADTAEYAKWVILLGEKGEFLKAQQWSNHEPSFILLSLLSYSLTKSYRLLFIIYAFMTTGFIFSALWKMRNKINTVVAVLFYIVFFQWSTCVNTMRQALAIAIVFYAITYIVDRKPFRFIMMIIFATFFHFSALWALILYPYMFKNGLIGQFMRTFKIWGTGILLFAPSLLVNIVKLVNVRYEGYHLWQKFGFGWLPTVALFILYIIEYHNESDDVKEQNFIFKELYLLATIFIITDYTAGEISRMRDYLRVYEMYAIGGIATPGIYSLWNRNRTMTKINFLIVGYYLAFWTLNMFNTLMSNSHYVFSLSLFT